MASRALSCDESVILHWQLPAPCHKSRRETKRISCNARSNRAAGMKLALEPSHPACGGNRSCLVIVGDSVDDWWKRDPSEVLDVCLERCRSVC